MAVGLASARSIRSSCPTGATPTRDDPAHRASDGRDLVTERGPVTGDGEHADPTTRLLAYP